MWVNTMANTFYGCTKRAIMKPFISKQLVVVMLCLRKHPFLFRSLLRVFSLIFKNIKVSLLIVPFWTVFCRYLLFFSLYNQLSTSTTTFGQAPIKASLITKGDMENIWSIMPDFRFCQTFTVVNVNSLSVKYYRYFITSINLQRNSYPPAWLIFLIKLMRSTFLRHSTTRSRRVIAVY